MNERYSYFETPDFLKKQNELEVLTGKLGEAKNMFEKNKFEDPYNFDLDFFSKEKKLDLGIGKNPNYKNPLTASNDADITQGLDNMGLSVASEGVTGETDSLFKRSTDTIKEKGNNFLDGMLGEKGGASDIATASAAFGSSALTSATTVANNDGESIMKGLDLTMKGAQAGMTIGGPVGAGIGAGVGFIYGAVDGFTDANKRGRNERNANKEAFETQRTRREQEQRMADGKDSLEKLTALRKAQLGYMI